LRRDEQLLAQGYVSQSAVDQARQQYAQAQAQYRAAQVAAQNANLSAGGATAAQADIRAAQAAVAQAQAAVNFVQAQLAQTAITAPFDGVVTQRNVDPGSQGAPGQTLVQVSQVDPIFVNVGIPDEDLQYVAVGRAANIAVDTLPGRTWTGRILYLNAGASQGTLSYLARVAIPNGDLRLKSGMVANVTFVQATRRGVLLVPRVAIAQTQTGNAVFIAQDNKAKRVAVQVGVQTQNVAQVTGPGIAAGTQVITQRPDSLQDGSPITIVSTAPATASIAR
jgi:membrane fusion protein (multidrug efflux system)